ncbi:hypothetical protein L6452_13188 [Arctium lappa]|uniref:Uncharacterized protein n=1 Tax=Arctium lappa TaxID=4217 RepID=A0ACB9CHH5_ARCLA|nr:hypothetical protein L6452_13188 [Arctium lappa]
MYELEGAKITSKNDFKKLNEGNMVTVFLQLRQAMMSRASSGSLLEMDWNKRPGESLFYWLGSIMRLEWNCLKNIAGEVESPEKLGQISEAWEGGKNKVN